MMTNTEAEKTKTTSLPTLRQLVLREALYQGRNCYIAGFNSTQRRSKIWDAISARSNLSSDLRAEGWSCFVDAYWAATGTSAEAEAAALLWQEEAGY